MKVKRSYVQVESLVTFTGVSVAAKLVQVQSNRSVEAIPTEQKFPKVSLVGKD